MVDMDKHACRRLADEAYKNKLWRESYVTWEFLEALPWAMEPGYLQINWDSIPGLYNRKRHLQTLVIEKKEWDHLSDPAQLAHFWEPTQNPDDFHRTLALAFSWTPFHDSPDAERKKEFVMSVAVVRKLSRHDGLPLLTASEEFRDSANETTHSLLLVRLHRKSLLFPDIYYDRYGQHFTLMHDTGKGYNVGDPQVFLGALLHNAYTSGKGPSPKAKLPPVFLDRPAEHPLIDSCTREYRDWTKDFPAPAGGEHPLEEHFVWLSTNCQPYTHDPGSPFVPLDFTLGLPPVREWPRQSGEPPWPLDPKDRPKPKPDLHAPADSTGASSLDEGKQQRKKKKHCRSKKAELKVTTRGLGTDDPVWMNTGSPESSNSSAGSQSEGDSGLGSNFRGTDTEPRTKAPLRASPDAWKDPTKAAEDASLSDRGDADEDVEMVDAEVIETKGPDNEGGPAPRHTPEPEEVLDQAPDLMEENPEEVAGEGEPQEPQDPDDDAPDLAGQVLQGFHTVTQTLSATYGSASSDIQQVIRRSLRESTNDDRTFIYGASNAIHCWVESVRPAMAGSEMGKGSGEAGKETKVTKDPTQLLADAREAGKDAIDAVLDLIPEVDHRLPPVYPRIDVASVLTISRHHTEETLRNVHSQISDLVRTHVAGPEQAGVFFNTILPITCSFQHQMDEMAINLLFPGSQLVPNMWGARREVLEGLSLVAPPSCSASWPASLVERVTSVPGTSGQSGLTRAPTKTSNPRASKLTPGSGKKTQQNIQQAAGLFWGDKRRREREEAEAQAQEEKCRKKPSRPILSLDEHKHSITELTNRAAPSRFGQPSGKTPSSASKDQVKPRKDPITVPDPSDDEPLSDQANELKAKARKWDPTPELVLVDDDDSTPLPGRQKTPKKSVPVEEEATEALAWCLKGKARAVQYNLELAALVDYRNKSFPNLKGPPNTDDHSKYLAWVRDISWSYLAKGNLWTARQYFQELQGCKDKETVAQGKAVLRDRGMLGIPQESGKTEPIKARYVIRVLRSIEGHIIDARDPDYGRDWNIGLYDIVSAASTKKVEKHGQMLWKGRWVSGKVNYGYCPFCSYASTNHRTLNNHIRMHLRLSLACGMPDCWYVTHSAESMWKHAATHNLQTSEPIVPPKKK